MISIYFCSRKDWDVLCSPSYDHLHREIDSSVLHQTGEGFSPVVSWSLTRVVAWTKGRGRDLAGVN